MILHRDELEAMINHDLIVVFHWEPVSFMNRLCSFSFRDLPEWRWKEKCKYGVIKFGLKQGQTYGSTLSSSLAYYRNILTPAAPL